MSQQARNVLVIMSDEHQARATGYAGNSVVQTPHLDALAMRGAAFDSCWTPSPICVPARGSFITGKWVHEIGTWDSVQAYQGMPQGWTHAARDAGFDVHSFGKLHHRSGAVDDGFSERHRPMFIAGQGWLQGLPRRDPLPYTEAAELAADTGTGHTTYTRYDERVTAEVIDWLGQPERHQQPWVSFVSLVAPHYPLSAPVEFTDMYPLSEVAPPEIPAHDFAHPAVAAMADFFDYDSYFDEAKRAEARRAYFALVSWMDHNVGQVLAALDAAQLSDDTLVIYTSDHGELLGNHGLWCKSFMFEDSVAVPLIAAGPGFTPGTKSSVNVNLIDIAPTIGVAIGITSPSNGFANSLQQIAGSPDQDRPGFTEYHDGGSVTGSFALRSGEWKYVEHIGFAPQLFHLPSDPHELDDLGEDPRCVHERSSCAETLRSLVDPATADGAAFASQEEILMTVGGRDGVERAFRFNHTPVPD